MTSGPPYRHVIWDWNGTLLDDVGTSVDVMNGLLARHRLPPLDLDRYHAIFDFPVRTYYERAGFDLSGRGSFEQLGQAWMEDYEEHRPRCPLQPGARELLHAVQAAGMTQSILSAYPRARLQEVVAELALGSYFVRLLGLDDIYAHSKLELGRQWLRELALPTVEVVLVGDTLHDLDVAQALGIDCLLVARGHHSAQRLGQRTARVYQRLTDLYAVFGLRRD